MLSNSEDSADKWGIKEGPIPCVDMKLDYCYDDDAGNLSSSYKNNPECWNKKLYQIAYEQSVSTSEHDKNILASMNETSCAGIQQICNYNDCVLKDDGKTWNENISSIEDYCSTCCPKQRDTSMNRTPDQYIDLTSSNAQSNFELLKNNYTKNQGNKTTLCPKDYVKKMKPCKKCDSNLLNSGTSCPNKTYDQCGGDGFKGETCCPPGDSCVKKSKWFSQCPGPGPSPSPGPSIPCPPVLSGSCGARIVQAPSESGCEYDNGIIKPECSNKCSIVKINDPQTYNLEKCLRRPEVPTSVKKDE